MDGVTLIAHVGDDFVKVVSPVGGDYPTLYVSHASDYQFAAPLACLDGRVVNAVAVRSHVHLSLAILNVLRNKRI